VNGLGKPFINRWRKQKSRRAVKFAEMAHCRVSRQGAEGVSGLNLYSMVVAIIGAIVVLLIYHAITGQRATR
jgi:hypothetical protein